MTRRELIGALPLAGAAQTPGGRRPNILFICSDQHAGSAMGCSGHGVVKTPNLDRLAANGVNFTAAYSGNPVCVPGRASMMTGRFASDVESYCNSSPFDGRVPTWGNLLRDAGYHTWATGKMDLWEKKDLGFEEEGTSHGHCTDPDITSLFRSPVCWRPGERNNANGAFKDREAPDLPKVERTLKFLRERSRGLGKPWCAYVGIVKPHPKFEAHLKYREMYPPEKMPLPTWPDGYLERRHDMFQVIANFKNVQVPVPEERVRRARAAYYGLITEMDELIGRLLDELDRTGQRENTLIVYTSDHGEMLGEHGLWLKNVLLEGAARVPLIVSGPGVPKGRTVTTPVSHCDMVAGLVDAGGARRVSGLRGHSILPLARGERGTHPGFCYSESHSEGNCTGSFLIRKDDWKYLYFTGGEPLLFNLKDDPGEFVNLAKDAKHAPVVKELHAHLTSLVDPDAVTAAAFAKQDKILKEIVARDTPQQFYGRLKGRLGPVQARVATIRHYGRIHA